MTVLTTQIVAKEFLMFFIPLIKSKTIDILYVNKFKDTNMLYTLLSAATFDSLHNYSCRYIQPAAEQMVNHLFSLRESHQKKLIFYPLKLNNCTQGARVRDREFSIRVFKEKENFIISLCFEFIKNFTVNSYLAGTDIFTKGEKNEKSE